MKVYFNMTANIIKLTNKLFKYYDIYIVYVVRLKIMRNYKKYFDLVICYQKNITSFNIIIETMFDVHFLWIENEKLKNKLINLNIEIIKWINIEKALQMSLYIDIFLFKSLWEDLLIGLFESIYMKKLCVVNDVNVIHNDKNRFISQCNTFVMDIKHVNVCEKDIYKLVSILVCVSLRVLEKCWNKSGYVTIREAVVS